MDIPWQAALLMVLVGYRFGIVSGLVSRGLCYPSQGWFRWVILYHGFFLRGAGCWLCCEIPLIPTYCLVYCTLLGGCDNGVILD